MTPHLIQIGDVLCAFELGAGVPTTVLAPIGALLDTARAASDLTVVVERVDAHAGADERASTASFFHGRVRVRSLADGALALDDGDARVTVERGGARITARVTDAALAPGGVFASTTLVIAAVLALRWRERFHLHAGLVRAEDGRHILLVGTSGAGKSTSTAMLGEAGLEVLCDDACFLVQQGGAVLVTSFAKPLHLDEAMLPFARSLAPRDWHILGQGRLEASFAPAPSASARIDAVLLISTERAAQTSTAAASASDAAAWLLESSALVAADGLPHRELHFALLGALAGQAKALHLVPGRDLLETPRAVWARIDEALRAAP